MDVVIQNRNVRLSDALRALAERRIRFALGRFADRIRSVRVRIADLNAARGGVDKQCLLEASLVPRGSLVVEITDTEIEPAVSRGVERLARRLRDVLERGRDRRRRPDRTGRDECTGGGD